MLDRNDDIGARRRSAFKAAAADAGLLKGPSRQLGARVPESLLKAAKEQSGIAATTDLIQYALARVALEDGFATKLLARKGSVPADLDLDF